jgi:hypothetical protein
MSDALLLGIFGIGLLVGPAIGGLVGWRYGMEAGAGVGAILIGLAGSTAALGFAWMGWQQLQAGVPFNPEGTPWGGAIGMGIFGLVPLAMGSFLVAVAIGNARPKRPVRDRPPISPRRERIGQNLTVAANLLLLGAFVWGIFIDDDTGAAGFGRMFAIVAAAVALHGVAFIVRRAGDWQAPAICFIIALGFGLFGALARLFG